MYFIPHVSRIALNAILFDRKRSYSPFFTALDLKALSNCRSKVKARLLVDAPDYWTDCSNDFIDIPGFTCIQVEVIDDAWRASQEVPQITIAISRTELGEIVAYLPHLLPAAEPVAVKTRNCSDTSLLACLLSANHYCVDPIDDTVLVRRQPIGQRQPA